MSLRKTGQNRISEQDDPLGGTLNRADFDKFLMQPDVAVIIQDVGVDVMGLIDMADMIYEDKDKEGKGLSFVDFIDVVLNMRGTNPSTVKDVKQQIRVMKNAMKESSFSLRKHIEQDMDKFRMEVMEQLIEIRRSQLGSDAGSEMGEMITKGATMVSLTPMSPDSAEDEEGEFQVSEMGFNPVDSMEL